MTRANPKAQRQAPPTPRIVENPIVIAAANQKSRRASQRRERGNSNRTACPHSGQVIWPAWMRMPPRR